MTVRYIRCGTDGLDWAELFLTHTVIASLTFKGLNLYPNKIVKH